MANMSDDLPFRSQAKQTATGVGPVGALLPFRERGQTAAGGADLADAVGPTDATGHGNEFPAKLKG